MHLVRAFHEVQHDSISSLGGSLLDWLGSLAHSVAIAAAIDAICIQKHEPYCIYSYTSGNKTHKKQTQKKETSILLPPPPILVASLPLLPPRSRLGAPHDALKPGTPTKLGIVCVSHLHVFPSNPHSCLLSPAFCGVGMAALVWPPCLRVSGDCAPMRDPVGLWPVAARARRASVRWNTRVVIFRSWPWLDDEAYSCCGSSPCCVYSMLCLGDQPSASSLKYIIRRSNRRVACGAD